MPTISIFYDPTAGIDLTDVVETLEISKPQRINPMAVPKRHGAVISEVVVLDPVRISIKGKVQEQDEITLRTSLDNMAKVFARVNKKFRIWDDRYYYAYVMSFNHDYIEGSGMSSASFSVDFFCADPFQYLLTEGSDTKTLTAADTLIDITNSYYQKAPFNLDNIGTAFVYPKFTITATNPLTQVKVKNLTTGREFVYTGTVLAGNILVIDCADFIVTNNNVEDLDNWNGSFLWLNPGINSMQIEGSVEATYVTTWKPRIH